MAVHVGYDIDDRSKTGIISISFDAATADDFTQIAPNVQQSANWTVIYRGSRVPVLVTKVDVPSRVVELECQGRILPNYRDLKDNDLTITYSQSGASPLTVAYKPPVKTPFFSTVKEAKDADIKINGSIQTAVSDKPQYQWDVEAKYSVPGLGHYGTLAPTFMSKASQQTNADPDSSKASAVYEKAFALHDSFQGFIVDADLIGYEFERKPKQEAILVNGVAKDQPYTEKNTNLAWSDTIHYVPGSIFRPFVISVGTEYGKSVSRSVKKTGTTVDSNQSILRSVLSIEYYSSFFWHCEGHVSTCKPSEEVAWVTLDGHYTLRSPFIAEPFKQVYVNSGNEFLTTKPRHYANLNASFPIHTGIAVTMKYQYGSLPPTFSFLDNQLSVGFELLLRTH